jgi:serine/threonine-protein kinase
LEEIILKVLAKEPSARYRTADQLGRVLLKFGTQHDLPGIAPSSTLPLEPAGPDFEYVEPPAPRPQVVPPVPAQEPLDIDWLSVGFGLLALIAVGGLVPFWMWIYFVYNPPLK